LRLCVKAICLQRFSFFPRDHRSCPNEAHMRPIWGPIVLRRKPLIVNHFRTLDEDVRPILL
jgi:hypothetical protein